MKIAYSILLVVLLNSIVAQTNYYNYYDGGFHPEKITVVKVSNDTVTLKFYFQSSERCQCEDSELFKLTKNSYGDFFSQPYNNEGEFIQANVYGGKVNSIVVKSSPEDPCCSLIAGIFLTKPTPPSGSTTTPALQSLIVVPERFLTYWNTFQQKMQVKDSIINKIDFPYAIDLSYLNTGEVSKSEFDLNGIQTFVNGNAFITNNFSELSNPKNKNLFIGKYDGGYMSEKLSSFFTNKFGNLEHIYVVANLCCYTESTAYKAYFREQNSAFKFIGFEGVEQGDYMGHTFNFMFGRNLMGFNLIGVL